MAVQFYTYRKHIVVSTSFAALTAIFFNNLFVSFSGERLCLAYGFEILVMQLCKPVHRRSLVLSIYLLLPEMVLINVSKITP
jgi:hypothetical protein